MPGENLTYKNTTSVFLIDCKPLYTNKRKVHKGEAKFCGAKY